MNLLAQIASDPWATPIAGLGLGGTFLYLFLRVARMAYEDRAEQAEARLDDIKADRDSWRVAYETLRDEKEAAAQRDRVLIQLLEELRKVAEVSKS